MNKKYKSGIIFGLFMAVIGLSLVYKTQVSDSPFVNGEQQSQRNIDLLSAAKNKQVTNINNDIYTAQGVDVVGKTPKIHDIRSLKGTQIHGNLRMDENGNLIIEKEIKQLFDYFLNVTGEVPREQLIEQIKQGIADYLPEPAQSQALKIFSDYLEYQTALQVEIDSGLYQVSPGNLDDLESTYRTRSQLRSFHLGNEVSTAFFKEEEARDWYTVGKLRVNANTSLSEQERQAELAVLENALPETHKKVLNKQRSREAVRDRIKELRSENANIYDMKEEWSKHYDSEAVDRFVKLEVSRNEWNNRFSSYLQKKETLADTYTNEADYNRAVAQLKSSLFNEAEARRVSVRESIAAE
jgi:lipase chaperone LimK